MRVNVKGESMGEWMYDGYTKVKTGAGRHTQYVENHIYKCLNCGWSVRVMRIEKPPRYCPNCGSDNSIERRTDERLHQQTSGD